MLYEDIGVIPLLTKTPRTPTLDFMEKCSDFIVVEKSFLPSHESGNLHAYYLVKSGISTEKVKRILKNFGYKGEFFYYGMKDSDSLSVQKVVLSDRWEKECICGKAKLIYMGRTLFKPKKGGFDHNFFAIKFPKHENVYETLRELKKLALFPNFYGHQRFGRKHPLNHEIAVELLNENKLNTRTWRGRILAESLQSYIFNRCLSRLISKGVFENKMGILLGNGYEEALKKTNVSLMHYQCSIEMANELGVLRQMTTRKFLKNQFRPLFIDTPLVGNYESRGKIIATLIMPPGSYASIVIREIFKDDEEWIYRKCLPERVCF
ncbi:MAG: tRNA pseudouridine(13) synthase TruD [Fervidicoccaceae archaeon]